jgi:hypothetical protein
MGGFFPGAYPLSRVTLTLFLLAIFFIAPSQLCQYRRRTSTLTAVAMPVPPYFSSWICGDWVFISGAYTLSHVTLTLFFAS